MISGVHIEVVLAATYAIFLAGVAFVWNSWRSILINDRSATGIPGLFTSTKWIYGNVPQDGNC